MSPKQEDLRPLIFKLADRVRYIKEAMQDTGNGTTGALHREARDAERLPIDEALHYFLGIRDAVGELEELLKYAKRVQAAWEQRVIPTKMDIALSTSHTVDGKRITTSEKLHASIRAEHREEAFAWLMKNDLFGTELSALITETVNASTLSASIKDAMRTKGIEFPEELFTTVVVPSVSVTAVASKKPKK